jgi:hypothetical protein
LADLQAIENSPVRSMTPVKSLGKKIAVGLVVVFSGAGCSKSKAPDRPMAAAQLSAIGRAYFEATEEMGHPPRNKEELMKYIKMTKKNPDNPEESVTVDAAEVLRSTNDNEDFVILWDVDVTKFDLSGRPSALPVLAYEKNGKDGKRYVLQIRHPSHVTDEKLESLPFPPGHKFP